MGELAVVSLKRITSARDGNLLVDLCPTWIRDASCALRLGASNTVLARHEAERLVYGFVADGTYVLDGEDATPELAPAVSVRLPRVGGHVATSPNGRSRQRTLWSDIANADRILSMRLDC